VDDLSPEQQLDFLLTIVGALALATPGGTIHIPDVLLRAARARMIDITALAEPAFARGIIIASLERPTNLVYPAE
jgi:hypothetical protein